MAAATGAVLTDASAVDQQDANKKSKLKWFFNKAADIAGRAAVTNTFKIAAVTVMAGIGASSVVSVGVASLASGIGSALYVYGKEAVKDYRAGTPVNWSDKERIKKARNALLIGAAGGAFGAWLAQTEFFKAGLEIAKDLGGRALDHLIPSAMAQDAPVAAGQSMMPAEVINAPRPPADIPAAKAPVKLPVETPAPKAPVVAKPVVEAPKRIVPRVAVRAPVTLPSAEAIAAGAADAKDANNVLGRVWEAAMKSDQAKGKFMAELLRADPDNLQSVSPQFLKDRAHDVLRLKDIPLQERLALAHDLAAEAKARGNRQAVQFLKDLVKLGYVEPVSAAPVPVTVADAVPEIKIVPEAVVVPEIAAVPEVKVFFTEAASCLVAPDQTVDCTVAAETMKPGDYISFAASDNPSMKAFTPLTEDSTEMPTRAFLHERLVADGVAKIESLRAALPKLVGLKP